MPGAKNLSLEDVDFSISAEVDAFLVGVMNEGLRRIQAEGAELQARGLMDAHGNLLSSELPLDMREGSERDFGG